MLAYMLSFFNLTMAANNPINTLTAFSWDAYTRGGFAIMPHASAPLSLKLERVSL